MGIKVDAAAMSKAKMNESSSRRPYAAMANNPAKAAMLFAR
jgi:hypothetical protein